jgi:hypothetical protein
VNVLCLLFASVNFTLFAFTDRTRLSRLYQELRQVPDATHRLGGMLWWAILAQIYLLALMFPLKAINYHVALGWSIMVVAGMCESVFTFRTLMAALTRNVSEQTFPVHDSVFYRAWGAFFNLGIIVVCTLLLAPGSQATP